MTSGLPPCLQTSVLFLLGSTGPVGSGGSLPQAATRTKRSSHERIAGSPLCKPPAMPWQAQPLDLQGGRLCHACHGRSELVAEGVLAVVPNGGVEVRAQRIAGPARLDRLLARALAVPAAGEVAARS